MKVGEIRIARTATTAHTEREKKRKTILLHRSVDIFTSFKRSPPDVSFFPADGIPYPLGSGTVYAMTFERFVLLLDALI